MTVARVRVRISVGEVEPVKMQISEVQNCDEHTDKHRGKDHAEYPGKYKTNKKVG